VWPDVKEQSEARNDGSFVVLDRSNSPRSHKRTMDSPTK
jgi:hypothetical protein